MKIKILYYFFFTGFILINTSCRKRIEKPESTILGSIAVDADANLNIVRKKEALLGNMVCDAIASELKQAGEVFDFVVVNGGNMRFNASIRPNGIYNAGSITSEIVDEILPYPDVSVIATITGKQLKQIFERSVASLPDDDGAFLQLSSDVSITIDTTKTPQVINLDETEIVSNGNRIVSIKINNLEFDSLNTYSVVFPNYIAEGNDGYVTLQKVEKNKLHYLENTQNGLLKEYIINNSPINPKLENRIIFK